MRPTLPALALVLLAAAAAEAGPERDLDTVVDRLVHTLMTTGAGDCKDVRHCSSGPAVPLAAKRDAASLSPNGSWPDCNYSDTTRTGGWSPHIHLNRMVNLAAVVRMTNSSDPVLIDPTARAIAFWLRRE